MDFVLIAQYLPYVLQLIQAAPTIKNILDEAASNDDVVTKIKQIAPVVAPVLEAIGSTLFPEAKAGFHIAAAATATYDQSVVKWIQGAANSLVGAGLVVDGVYGPKTKVGVKKLQAYLGVEVDGFAGQITQAAIGVALSKL